MPITYPPLVVQIGGNTSGALANVRSGTLFLAGGNNITLSQNANSISIIGGAGGGGGLIGGGSASTLAMWNATNQLTNSPFEVGASSQLVIGPNFIDIEETATPATPPADTLRIYAAGVGDITQLRMLTPSGSILVIAQDNTFIVRNNTGSPLAKGAAVYINNSFGSDPTVELARADADATMPVVGLVYDDILNGDEGRVLFTGVLNDVDTSAFVEGDRLFISATNAGELTSTQPSHPSLQQRVGIVIDVDATAGRILVLLGAIEGEDHGTNQNSWIIGNAGAGAKSVIFQNADSGILAWNPSVDRTIFLPDASGTLALAGNVIEGGGNASTLAMWDGTGTRTITNSPFQVGASSQLVIGPRWIDIEESAGDPPTPPANVMRLHATDDGGLTRLRVATPSGDLIVLAQDNSFVARNNSGSTIVKGAVVYITGSSGQRPTIGLAQANADATMPCVGVMLDDTVNNSQGRVLFTGILENFDTSAFSEGDRLYVSASVAGTLTTTEPAHPNLGQRVAVVTNAHATQGRMLIILGAVRGDQTGTNKNAWIVGDGAAGAKTVLFQNVNSGNLVWNPTAARTVNIPDATGTLVLGTFATTASAVASANVVGTNTSRFALEDHQHLGVFSVGVSNLGNTIGDTGVRPGRWVLQGGNNITLSQITAAASLQTIIISGPNTAAQTAESNTFGISNLGNTAGTSGVISGPQVRLLLAGGNNVTLSQSINGSSATITISAFNQTVESNTFGISNLGNTSGTSGVVSGGQVRVLFAGGNNVTLSQSINGVSATITISAAGAGTGAFSAGMSTQGNTSGTTGLVGNQIVFVGGNNVTLSQSINGQSATLTISAGAGGGGALPKRFLQLEAFRFSLSNLTVITAITNTPFFMPLFNPGELTISRINWEMSRVTNVANAFTVTMGFYTYVNATQISLSTSFSAVFSNTATASITGIRRFGMAPAASFSLSPGGYVFGMAFSAAATASMNYNIRGYSGAVQAGAILNGTDQYNTATNYNVFPFFGRYSATVAFPGSVADSAVRGQFSGASAPINAWIGINED